MEVSLRLQVLAAIPQGRNTCYPPNSKLLTPDLVWLFLRTEKHLALARTRSLDQQARSPVTMSTKRCVASSLLFCFMESVKFWDITTALCVYLLSSYIKCFHRHPVISHRRQGNFIYGSGRLTTAKESSFVSDHIVYGRTAVLISVYRSHILI
jgi:hypothetical protein